MATKQFPATVLGKIDQNLALGSVRALRKCLGITEYSLPLPKMVTHRDPHLDEYFATLLFRTIHADQAEFTPTVEISQRDKTLSFELHPQIFQSVIFGLIKNEDELELAGQNVVVYDEHTGSGQKLAASVSHLLINKIVASKAPNLNKIGDTLKIVDQVDSGGENGGGRLHISAMIKNLHRTNTHEADTGAMGWLSSAHKEAVIYAALSAIAMVDLTISPADAVAQLLGYWQTYRSGGWVVGSDEAANNIEDTIRNYKSDSRLTLPNIAYALGVYWDKQVVQYVLETYFESLVQTQQDFISNLDDAVVETTIPIGQARVEYIRSGLKDKLPHRARLYKLNKERKPGMVVVHTPQYGITMICKSNFFSQEVWRKFMTRLQELEPGLWYEVKNDTKQTVDFIVNGTRAHLEVPPTRLGAEDFARILQSVLRK